MFNLKMNYTPAFDANQYYHVYNRSNNKEVIFLNDNNRSYFLKLYKRYLGSILDTYAFCLLPNHFHFLVQVKSLEEITLFLKQRKNSLLTTVLIKEKRKEKETEIDIGLIVKHQFQRFFTAYAKAFNKYHTRSGNLFNRPFKRILVTEESYLLYLLYYIHVNPRKHFIRKDWYNYSWSSYQSYLSNSATHIVRDVVLNEWFQGKEHFIQFHEEMPNTTCDDRLLLDEEQ